MSPSATVSGDSALWEQILSSGADRERLYLQSLLERLCELDQLEAVGVYLASSVTLDLELAVGDRSRLPESLSVDEAAERGSLVLPGAVLICEPSAAVTGDLMAPLSVAVGAALRALQLQQRLKRQSFEAKYRGVELEALYDVGLAIAATLNPDDLTEEILVRAVSLLDARRGALYLLKGTTYRLHGTFGGDAAESFSAEMADAERLSGPRLGGELDLLEGASHLLAVPIEVDGKVLGLIVVADKESRQGVGPFGESDHRTLLLFANQAAIALQNAYLHQQALEKKRLESEMELAAEIQTRLLPESVPVVPGFELMGWNRPARHVGGDYYDFFQVEDDRLALLVGDVAGKGMPAALMVSTLHSALRLLSDQVDVCSTMVERLNSHIAASVAPNKFITLWIAKLNPATGDLRYVNAGHNPAFLVSDAGKCTELKAGGLPLGLFSRSRYETQSVQLKGGDLVCLYTDGITEAVSPEDEEFGNDRLVDLLRTHHSKPLEEVAREIEGAISEFSDGRSQMDDQTLVLLRKTDRDAV